MTRYIIVATQNINKIPDFVRHLDKYDIQVIHHTQPQDTDVFILSLYNDKNVISILREHSSLVDNNNTLIDLNTILPLQLASHVSVLDVCIIKNHTVCETTQYTYKTNGYIINTRSPDMDNVFGWDDIFYVFSCHQNYHTLRQLGLKISSRDMVLSQYIIDHIYYKQKIDLYHNPQNLSQSVDFHTEGISQLLSKLCRHNPVIVTYGIHNIINTVFTNGIYFMSPINRRIKLNWNPGVNGIPFTRKDKDEMHELTYMIHDFGHFAFKPDLIFTGSHPDPIVESLNRKIYLLSRMMSEAITLVMADMIFVDGILKSGNSYDTVSERKIYPLFQHLNLSLSTNYIDTVRKLMYANTIYCLLGDDSEFVKLLSSDSPSDITSLNQSLQDYKNKYSQFFIQDYRWTDANYTRMTAKSPLFNKWWSLVSPIVDKFNLNLISIDQLRSVLNITTHHTTRQIIDRIFDHTFNTVRFILLSSPSTNTPINFQNNLKLAFVRYLCNQLFMFVQYSFDPNSSIYITRLLHFIDNIHSTPSFSHDYISTIRSFINVYIDTCRSNNYITLDDANTYKQLYSIIDPYYVNYNTTFPLSLSQVSDYLLHQK